MIIDRLNNASCYVAVHPKLIKAFEFLSRTDLDRLEPGRYELEGAELFATVDRYQTKPQSAGRWEAHRRYMDVQYLVSGTERMGVGSTAGMTILTPYDEKKDLVFLEGGGDFFTVTAGQFVIFAPQDAHMPGISAGEPQSVKKIVVKIQVG